MNDLGSGQETVYPWYQTIEGDSIYQGDFLPNLEVLVPDASSEGNQ